jgi:serine/threonine protein kinase
VTHIATGRKLAWKQIPLIDGREDQIMQEAEIVKGIKSPYVVEILDSFIDDGFLYMVMEFFEAETLVTIYDELRTSKKLISEKVFTFIVFIALFLITFLYFDEIRKLLIF